MIQEYHNRFYALDFLKTEEETEPKFYVGFELEVENGDKDCYEHDAIAEQIDGEYGEELQLCFEKDASLNSGFEIVSQPMTEKYYHKKKESLSNIFQYLQDCGYISHNSCNCGLHFHISRSAFGDTEEKQQKNIDKLILFCEFYKEELKRLSRRRDFGYARFLESQANENLYKKIKNSSKFLGKYDKECRERFRIVNTTNANTIEIRLFKGTLNFNTFWSDLEFIFSLVEYITSNKKITLSKVLNNNKYQTLKNYAKEKNIYCDIPLTDDTEHIEKELADIKKIASEYKKESKKIFTENITSDFQKYIEKTENISQAIINFQNICTNINDSITNANTDEINEINLLTKNLKASLQDYLTRLENFTNSDIYSDETKNNIKKLKNTLNATESEI